MAQVTEEAIINKVAGYFESVDGIRTAYGFAKNPDNLNAGDLPATVMVPREIQMDQKGHHNIWRNVFDIIAVTFVATRQTAGGKLIFLENRTISLMPSVRQKFQTESVVSDLLGLGLVRAHIQSIRYGGGGPLLTYNGIEYIGFITSFDFKEQN